MPLLSCGTKKLIFTVMGNPMGQGRVRFTRQGNFVKTYDPKESVDEKAAIRLLAQDAVRRAYWEMPSPDMPIELNLDLYCPIPSSKQLWFKHAALNDLIVPLAKPDADNVAKMYMDALSKTVYPDDKQVFRLSIDTHYSDTPRVEVTVIGYYLNYGDIKAQAKAYQLLLTRGRENEKVSK